MAKIPAPSLTVVLVLLLLALCCSGVFAQPPISIACPIDCAVNSNVQSQINACVKLAELCNPDVQVVGLVDFQALLGTTDITETTPTNFIYQPTGELVDRVVCTGLVTNVTEINGTTVRVCVVVYFCYTNPSTTINIALTGTCSMSQFNFPAILALNIVTPPGSPPAIISGPGLTTDPLNPTNISYQNVIFDGAGTLQPFFTECMQNSNFSFINVTFVNWQGPYMFKYETCIYASSLIMENVYIQDVPGSVIWLEGIQDLRVEGLECARCAKLKDAEAFHLFVSPASTGNIDILNSNLYSIQDLLPTRCRYCLGVGNDGFCGSRCNQGLVQVYDRITTGASGTCDTTTISFISYSTGLPVVLADYDPTCRVYVSPKCNVLTLTDSQNFTNQIDTPSGDILWNEPVADPLLQDYDMPLLCSPGGTIETDPPGPFYTSNFDNRLGDPVQLDIVPPLPIPPPFNDPSLETIGTGWTETKTLASGYGNGSPGSWNNIVNGGKADPSAYVGQYVFRTDQKIRRRLDAVVTFPSAVIPTDTFTITFRGSRKDGQNEASRWPITHHLNFYVDNVLIYTRNGPQIRALLPAGDVWYPFTYSFTGVTVAVGLHLFSVEVDFLAPSDAATFQMDNLFCGLILGGLTDIGSFEYKAVAWTGSYPGSPGSTPIFPVGGDESNCNAHTGNNRMVCGPGGTFIEQQVFFPQNGIYAVRVFAQRRQGTTNFVGNFLRLTVDGVDQDDTLIEADQLPNQDTYYEIILEGRVKVPGSGGTHTIRMACNFNNGNPAVNMCFDDFRLEAVGVVLAVPPTNLGFSAGVLSTAPTIALKTCQCNDTAPQPRDPIVLPCQYAIQDDIVCTEQVPRCCVQKYLVPEAQPLLAPVFWQNCNNVASSNCTFLVNCQFNTTFGAGGQVTDCRQFRCPNRNTTGGVAANIPVTSLSDISYFLANCNETFPQIVANVVVPGSSLVPGVTVTTGNALVYPPSLFQTTGTILVDEPEQFAYFQGCGQADNSDCLIYAYCSPLVLDASQPNGWYIPGCSQLACTNPSGDVLQNINQFWNCNVTATGITLTDIDGGWQANYLGYNISVPTNFTVYQNVSVVNTTTNTSSIQLLPVIVTRPVITPAAVLTVFDDVAFGIWFTTWYLELQHTSITGSPFSGGGVATGCFPYALFRLCPCNASGTYNVPYQPPSTGINPLDPATNAGTTDTYYTCTAGASSCSCDPTVFNSQVQNGTKGWNILLVPDTVNRFRFFNNRAQQYKVCTSVQQVSFDLIKNNSLVVPQRDDQVSTIRTVLQNDNEFMSCVYDGLQGNLNGIYTESCDIITSGGSSSPRIPCALQYTDQAQADCTVNKLAVPDSAGYGVTLFVNPADAVLAPGCDSIYVMGGGDSPTVTNTYYESNIIFDKTTRNMVLWSVDLPRPIIVGTHQVGTKADNLTMLGIHFIHPADNQNPHFGITKDKGTPNMDRLTFSNCILEGGGCRKCGILNTDRLNNLFISNTLMTQWTFFMLKLPDTMNVNISRCVVSECTGRVIDIRYSQGYWFDQNVFYDVRGQEDLSGTSIVSLTASLRTACNGNGYAFNCLFREQLQMVTNISRTTARFKDRCFYLSGGSILANQIYDNSCEMAQEGFVLAKMENINSAQITFLMGLNPLVVPSLTQLRDDRTQRKFWGPDWKLLKLQTGFLNNGGSSIALTSQLSTDRDTAPYFITVAPPICKSNWNWDNRWGFGEGLEWPRMGYAKFHNASLMVRRCTDRQRVFDDLGQQIDTFTGRVTADNGSRISPDVIVTTRNGTLTSDDSTACCKSPTYKPALEGIDNRVQTQRWNMTMLTFYLTALQIPSDHWSCTPDKFNDEDTTVQLDAQKQAIPRWLVLDNIEFNGRGILPAQHLFAFDCLIGTIYNARKFKPSLSSLPPFTTATVRISNCDVINYAGYNQDGRVPQGGDALSVGFPHAEGFKFRAYNRRNTNTTFYMNNCTFAELDFGALQTHFFTNATVENSRFFNCSGRSYGNYACVAMTGNNIEALVQSTKHYNASLEVLSAPSYLLMRNNTHLNTIDMIYEYDGKKGQPGYVTAWVYTGYPNNTDFCILNNSAYGLSAGQRNALILNRTFLKCSKYLVQPADPPPLPDRQRYLREQCIAGGLERIRGRFHDIMDGISTRDSHGETIFCDQDATVGITCCPLKDPDQCYVTNDPNLMLPGNPLFNTFIFGDINFAIINCSAARRVITVIGDADPFSTGQQSPQTYTFVINVQVPLVSVVGVTGEMLIQATAGVTIVSSGHWLDTQCQKVTVSGFTFQHDGLVRGIWDQTVVPACNLRWDGCRFTSIYDRLFLDIVLNGDNVKLLNSRIQGLDTGSVTNPRTGVRIRGTCAESFITVSNCRFRDISGYGLDLLDVVHYVVKRNNLRNVGGRDVATRIPFAIRAGNCQPPPAPPGAARITFSHNKVRTTQTAAAIAPEKMRACRVERYDRGAARYDLDFNDCRGMDIGLGVIIADPPFDISPPNRKAEVRGLAVSRWNIQSRGLPNAGPNDERFDIVYGDPSQDANLFADPHSPANEGRWCQEGCPTDQLDIIFIIAGVLGALLALCLGLCLATGCCVRSTHRERYFQPWNEGSPQPKQRPGFGDLGTQSMAGVFNQPVVTRPPPVGYVRSEINRAASRIGAAVTGVLSTGAAIVSKRKEKKTKGPDENRTPLMANAGVSSEDEDF